MWPFRKKKRPDAHRSAAEAMLTVTPEDLEYVRRSIMGDAQHN